MHEYYRDLLLNGKIELPVQFTQLVGEQYEERMDSFFASLFHNYLKNGAEATTSLPYWSNKFIEDKSIDGIAFNSMLRHLSLSGWIVTSVIHTRNWADVRINENKLLTFVTEDELIEIRRTYKFHQYSMEEEALTSNSSKTKIGHDIVDSGLSRPGFTKSGNYKFKLDSKYINKYFLELRDNLTKSMLKIQAKYPKRNILNGETDYATISEDILNSHCFAPHKRYTTGENINDSRGRAISSVLSKVFNPITYKDARSLLIIEPALPVPASIQAQQDMTDAVYLFIAELHGIRRAKNKASKLKQGRQFYMSKDIPEMHSLSDLHEIIWIQRLYEELDAFFIHDSSEPYGWTVPIELDFSASLLMIEGALLGDHNLLSMTNAHGKQINDPWYINGIPRIQLKFAMTPRLYGSSATTQKLWDQNHLSYTKEQVKAVDHEIRHGNMALPNAFKDFIIKHVDPKPDMTVNIDGEVFDIKCNRFKNVGDFNVEYRFYDTESKYIKTIHHTHTKRIPDLNQFKRYFQTLLIHNLDSKIEDNICQKLNSWNIPIHDAILVGPMFATKARILGSAGIDGIYDRRKTILSRYFRSIGIEPQTMLQWNKTVMSRVKPVKSFKCNLMAMK